MRLNALLRRFLSKSNTQHTYEWISNNWNGWAILMLLTSRTAHNFAQPTIQSNCLFWCFDMSFVLDGGGNGNGNGTLTKKKSIVFQNPTQSAYNEFGSKSKTWTSMPQRACVFVCPFPENLHVIARLSSQRLFVHWKSKQITLFAFLKCRCLWRALK